MSESKHKIGRSFGKVNSLRAKLIVSAAPWVLFNKWKNLKLMSGKIIKLLLARIYFEVTNLSLKQKKLLLCD